MHFFLISKEDDLLDLLDIEASILTGFLSLKDKCEEKFLAKTECEKHDFESQNEPIDLTKYITNFELNKDLKKLPINFELGVDEMFNTKESASLSKNISLKDKILLGNFLFARVLKSNELYDEQIIRNLVSLIPLRNIDILVSIHFCLN